MLLLTAPTSVPGTYRFTPALARTLTIQPLDVRRAAWTHRLFGTARQIKGQSVALLREAATHQGCSPLALDWSVTA